MSLSNIGMPELLIVLVILMLLFGTKRLKSLGGDLGGAIRGFRRAMDGRELNEPAAKPMIAKRRGESPIVVTAETVHHQAPDSGGR